MAVVVVGDSDQEIDGRRFSVSVWEIEAEEDDRRPGSGWDREGYEIASAGKYVAIIEDEEGEDGYQSWISDSASIHDTAEAALQEGLAAIVTAYKRGYSWRDFE